jgi:hypothetical protein
VKETFNNKLNYNQSLLHEKKLKRNELNLREIKSNEKSAVQSWGDVAWSVPSFYNWLSKG